MGTLVSLAMLHLMKSGVLSSEIVTQFLSGCDRFCLVADSEQSFYLLTGADGSPGAGEEAEQLCVLPENMLGGAAGFGGCDGYNIFGGADDSNNSDSSNNPNNSSGSVNPFVSEPNVHSFDTDIDFLQSPTLAFTYPPRIAPPPSLDAQLREVAFAKYYVLSALSIDKRRGWRAPQAWKILSVILCFEGKEQSAKTALLTSQSLSKMSPKVHSLIDLIPTSDLI